MFGVQEIVVLISITLTTTATVVDILDYGNLEDGARPLPPELSFISANKTDNEILIEECMNDYGACIAAEKVQMFCAINQEHVKRTFYTLCEMAYENCKLQKHVWEYLRDDECEHKNSTTTVKKRYKL